MTSIHSPSHLPNGAKRPMTLLLVVGLLAGTTLLLPGCSGGGGGAATPVTAPAPVAYFSCLPKAPAAGQGVQFTDASSGSPTAWLWNFGDGAISTLQNPTHTFATSGLYQVTLTATNASGSHQATMVLTVAVAPVTTLKLTSSVGAEGGTLPIDYTLDGSGASPDLSWTGTPTGTQAFAVLMSTLPGDGTTRYNWVLYNLPGSSTGLARNTQAGTCGKSDDVVVAYAPPQSTGPGLKTYTWTVYALSGTPSLPTDPSQVTGAVLAQAIAPLTLGKGSLSLGYTRQAPVAAFTSAVNGSTVTFTNASGLSATSYAWTFGDGTTSTDKNPVHTYAAGGTYPVTLTSTNGFGSQTVSQNVTLTSVPSLPVADGFVAPASPAAGAMAVFTDLSTGGPTSWLWTFGDGTTSTDPHPAHTYTNPGSYGVSLRVANAQGFQTKSFTLTVGPAVPSTAKMNLAQTISDQAQNTTLAFSGLAIMTGNLEAQSFYPPGKVADYTGFQFLRDNDPSDMGHNTSFLTRVANNVISILTDAQLKQLADLAISQQAQFQLYGYKRFPLMKAFRRLVDGDLPSGTTGLSLEAVKAASRELYLIDGQVSFDRALLYASIYNGLSASQKAYLDAMVGKGWSAWPDVPDSVVKDRLKALPGADAVAIMTYAGDIFSWYACTVEGDIYFCPERQGTYYGGFYIKDAPAIGHEGYSIDQQLTATAGSALCDTKAGYVTGAQAAVMSSLVGTQRANLYGAGADSIVGVRTQISQLLRALRTSTAHADAIKARVLALSARYGELDGLNNHAYATVFAQVWKSLTADQKTRVQALRHSILSGKYSDGTPFDFTVCTTPFLYSAVIKDLTLLAPYLSATDTLFN